MALLKENPPLSTWPPVHSRSYYPTTHQGRTLLRSYPRVPKPRSRVAPDAQLARWRGWLVTVRRLFLAEVARRWTAGAAPNGQAWWNALAAANTIYTYTGNVKIVTGKHFWVWYYTQLNEHLRFFQYYWGSRELNTAVYPKLPWAPEATPNASVYTATSPTQVTLLHDYPTGVCTWSLMAWLTLNPKITPGTPDPQHIASYDWEFFYTPPYNRIRFLFSDLRPTVKPGTAARLWWNFFIYRRRIPDAGPWFDIYTPTPRRSLDFAFT